MSEVLLYVKANWFEILVTAYIAAGALGPVARRLGFPRVAHALEGFGLAFVALAAAFRPGAALPPPPPPGEGGQ